MAQHNDKNEYNKPMPVKLATPSVAGYPNNVKSTQNMKTRGTGAATKGTKYNSKVC